MPGPGLRAGPNTTRDGETQAGGREAERVNRPTAPGRNLEETGAEAIRSALAPKAKSIDFPKNHLEKVEDGTVIKVELKSSDERTSDQMLTRATAVKKLLAEHGLQPEVKGENSGGVKVMGWVPAEKITLVETAIAKITGESARDGVVITESKEARPVMVGEFAGVFVADYETPTGTENLSTAQVLENPLERKVKPRKDVLLDLELNEGEAATLKVKFEDPEKNLQTILDIVRRFNGRVVSTGTDALEIVCLGEKTMDRALEIAIEVKAHVKTVSISQQKVRITNLENTPILLGDARNEWDVLENYLAANPGPAPDVLPLKIAVSEKAYERRERDERSRTEVTTTRVHVEGAASNGVAIIDGAVRAEVLYMEKTDHPLIGRDEEMTKMRMALAEAVNVDPGLNISIQSIVGAPGIGKSKVLDGLIEEQKKLENIAVYVTASPTHAFDDGFWLKELVKRFAELKETGGATGDADLDGFLSGITPAVQSFLDGNPVETGGKEQLAREIRTLITQTKPEKLKTIFADNLETIDGLSASILDLIMREGRTEMPNVAFVLAARTKSGEELQGPPSFKAWFEGEATVELSGLKLTDESGAPNATCKAFVGSRIGAKPGDEIDENLLRWVAKRSKGIPLGVVELCRMVVEEGAIQRFASGRWAFRQDDLSQLEGMAEKTTRSITFGRLERLFRNPSEILQDTYAVLISVLPASAALIDLLVKKGLLDTSTITQLQRDGIIEGNLGKGIAWTHPSLGETEISTEEGRREGVTRFIKKPRLRKANTTLAETMREAFRDAKKYGLDPVTEQTTLFTIGAAARSPKLIGQYAVPATKRQMAGWMNGEVLKTVTVAEREGGAHLYPAQKNELSLLKGQAQMRLGQYDEAENTLSALWEGTKNLPMGPAVIEERCNNLYVSGGKLDILEKLITEWDVLANTSYPPENKEKVLLYKGYLQFRKGNLKGATGATRIFSGLAGVTNERGFPVLTEPTLLREAIRMYGMARYNEIRLDARLDQEGLEEVIKHDSTQLRKLQETVPFFQTFLAEALRDSRNLDHTRVASAAQRMATVRRLGGDFSGAKESARASMASGKIAGLPIHMAIGANALGEAALAEGSHDEAIRVLQQAQTLAASSRSSVNQAPQITYNLATAHLKSGDPEKAFLVGIECARGFVVDTLRRQGVSVRTTDPREIDLIITRKIQEGEVNLPTPDFLFYVLPLLGAAMKAASALSRRIQTPLPYYISGTVVASGVSGITSHLAEIVSKDMIPEGNGRTAYIRKLEEKQTNIAELGKMAA